jgi:hypothetical protein
MQDACWLVRAPVRIDVGSVFQKKIRNLKLPIHARPCQRDVQDVLRVRGAANEGVTTPNAKNRTLVRRG